MNRRDAIKMGAAATLTTLASGPSLAARSALRVLILGGTGFIGPHMIQALRQHGHRVTLFNNDKRSAEQFPDLESLLGDRDGKIEALKGRDWDVVIDNSGYVPRIVKLTADLLQDHVQHYVFISSISAYGDFSQPGIDENSTRAVLKDPTVEEITGETYGGLKAACEQVIENVYGKRSTLIRPTYIVGPGDPTDRFTYWPVRVSRGGEMLAPGNAADPIQFIDVRDLAAFTRDCVERRFSGAYNACNTPREVSIGQLLDASREVSRAEPQIIWVDAKFLTEQGAAESIPIWASPVGESAGIALVKNERAVAQGLKFRSLRDTIRDTLTWHAARPAEQREKLKAGLTAEKERELLDKWKASRKADAAA